MCSLSNEYTYHVSLPGGGHNLISADAADEDAGYRAVKAWFRNQGLAYLNITCIEALEV